MNINGDSMYSSHNVTTLPVAIATLLIVSNDELIDSSLVLFNTAPIIWNPPTGSQPPFCRAFLYTEKHRS